MDEELRILQFISEYGRASFSDCFRFARKEIDMHSKTTLSSILKWFLEKNFVEKEKRVYRITSGGIEFLSLLQRGKEKIIDPSILHAYLVESDLPPHDLREKIDEFTKYLKKLKFDNYALSGYKFGGRENRWNKMVQLVGSGPFKVLLGRKIVKKKEKGKETIAPIYGIIPPIIEAHISEVLFIFRIHLPEEGEITSLRDVFKTDREMMAMLRNWLNSTEDYIRIRLYDVFRGKIELKPIALRRWIEPLPLPLEVDTGGENKFGSTATQPFDKECSPRP